MIYNFIDLFAGAGGLSEGFIQAGFEPIAHAKIDRSASNSLKRNSLGGKEVVNQTKAYIGIKRV